MKKTFLAATLSVFLLGLAVPAFAVPTVTPEQEKSVQHQHQKCEHEKGKLEAFLKDSLDKNKGDLSKVKQDVDKFVAERKAQREAKLAELAKEKGISVDELKAQFKQKHQEKISEKAKQQGITPEELKQHAAKKRAAHLEQMAKNLGLTPEQLQQILPAHPAR